MERKYIKHHGIKGQRWGVRRFQNEDGSLTPAGIKRYRKLDERWIAKKSEKIYSKALKESKPEMRQYTKTMDQTAGRRTIVNNYNRRLAEVMRTKTKDIRSPSGKVIEWVAKRGELGVHMALADQGYDINQLKNGVWPDGRIGYRKTKVDMQETKGRK